MRGEENRMKIEILYPDIANLYGEKGHMDFFTKIFPKATIIETHITSRPSFLDEEIDLVYLGVMAEKYQEQIIKAWLPLKDRIKERIEEGMHFLFIGNAMEILGNYIEKDNGERIEGLGIFPMYAKRQMMKRINCLYHGKFEDRITVIGFKTQFTYSYMEEENFPFLFKTIRGDGMNPTTKGEGIHYKNFMATYLIGPLLISNPDFTREFMSMFKDHAEDVPFYNELKEAFDIRLKEFLNPRTTL